MGVLPDSREGDLKMQLKVGIIAQRAYWGDSLHPITSPLLGLIQGLVGPFDEKRR